VAISAIHFAAMLLIVGLAFRMIQYQWPESPVAKALAVIY
jgi:hypothetical protein